MFRLLIAASGSKANATLVERDGHLLLIDCGTTYKALEAALCGFGLCPDMIDAVLVTHSHSDHTKGLAVLRKHTSAPFYSAVDIDGCRKMTDTLDISGMKITFFPCSHDVPCVGYKIMSDGKTVAVATDTGCVSEDMLENLLGSDTVMLECNHDTDMLKYGPYPATLKSRIASANGHLSNADCARVLTYLAVNGTKRAVLAHLSETNNSPLVAKAAVTESLRKYGLDSKMTVLCADTLTQTEI